MRIRKAHLVGVVISLLAVTFIVPFDSVVLPAASVTIVDNSGNPIPDVIVKEEWKDVTVENDMHVELVRTGENGVAAFPTRRVRSFLLKRLVNWSWRISTQGVHASIGPYGTLTAYSNDDPHLWGWVGYHRNGGKWPEHLELKQWQAAAYP